MKNAFNNLNKRDPLLPRWQALWQRFGVENADLAAAGQDVIAAYGHGRYYHTQDHLASVLTELDWAKGALEKNGELSALSSDAKQKLFDTVELALWYHDVVYDVEAKHGDNEKQSRDLFLSDAEKFGLAASVRKEIASLIDLTAHNKDAKTLMERLMTDCDLAILGASPAVFRKYDADIRKEYAYVPETIYKTERINVLAGFLKQKPIFKTAAFRKKLEAQAEKNLTDAITPTIYRASTPPSIG
jgi:predicted metal-dependent HD superfamily phosphohydrolase